MPTRKLEFIGHNGNRLAGRLDLSMGPPRCRWDTVWAAQRCWRRPVAHPEVKAVATLAAPSEPA